MQRGAPRNCSTLLCCETWTKSEHRVSSTTGEGVQGQPPVKLLHRSEFQGEKQYLKTGLLRGPQLGLPFCQIGGAVLLSTP
jgi:hypothetical protein